MIDLKKDIRNSTMLCIFLFFLCTFIIGFIGGSFANNLFNNKNTEDSIKAEDLVSQNKDSGEISTAQLVSLVENSVVEIEAELFSSEEIDAKENKIIIGAGSGVILTENGYIVTNFHVVKNAKNIKVKLHDANEYPAKLIGQDENEDIAVLKIEANNLTPVNFRNSDEIKVGEHVIVIGNPLGTLGGSVTDGIISAVDRSINIDGKEMTLLQTNAEINQGNSGGGMFGENGQFVGLIVAKSTGDDLEGLGFAIPANIVKNVVNKLI